MHPGAWPVFWHQDPDRYASTSKPHNSLKEGFLKDAWFLEGRVPGSMKGEQSSREPDRYTFINRLSLYKTGTQYCWGPSVVSGVLNW